MKKAAAVILVLALCFTTVFVYGDYFKKEEVIDSGIIVRATDFEDIRAALIESGYFDRDDGYRSGMKFAGDSMILFSTTDDAEASVSMDINMNGIVNDVILESAESIGTASPGEGGSGSGDFSGTNVQIQGIDEADVIKTDGEYLYIAANQAIYIVKLLDEKTSEMELVSVLNIDEFSHADNIFIDKNRLVVFGNRYVPQPKAGSDIMGGAVDKEDSELRVINNSFVSSDMAKVDIAIDYDGVWFNEINQAFVKIYDTSDKTAPELIQDFAVDGSFRTARKSGNFVYVLSNEHIHYGIDIEKAGEDEIMPYYTDTLVNDGERTMLPVSDVFICPVTDSTSFTTLAVVDISGDTPAELQSYMGSINEFYMNGEAAYIMFSEYDWEAQTSATNIVALDVDGMDVSYRAEGSVPGSLLNQFSMDEYDGYFRIATTALDNEEGSSLYVLDRDMNIVGQINSIAEGEQIYSVRFMGKRAYIVTFETMDPFFTVDLSDPENPYIAGELKLPGYSNYLHQIDENTVLGIGRDTQEMYVKNPDGTETVVGFQQGGIKLSLFDISDFANPTELHSLVVGSENAWSDALHNHKAIVVDRANGLIGFSLNDHSYYSGWYKPAESGAYVFDVSGGEVEISGIMESIKKHYSGGEWNPVDNIERLCYAGDNYYYLQGGELRAFDRVTYEETGRIDL